MRRQSDLDDIYGVRGMTSNPLDKDNEVPETGFRHSDAYHRYFRGYTEIRREQPNGRFKVERYYTQPWIVSTATPKQYWLARLVYAALVAVSWMLYLKTMVADLGSNRCWFVAVPGLPAVIVLFLLSVVTVTYIVAPRKMTLWKHASGSGRMKTLSLVTGGCMALTAALKAVYLLTGGSNASGELVSIGITLAAAACAAALYVLERGVEYTTIPNDTALPEGDAYEIW